MFPFNFPVSPPEPAQPVVLHLSAAEAPQSKDRTVGLCVLIENNPHPNGLHSAALSPLTAVQNYFRVVEHRQMTAAGKLSVLEPARHAKVTASADGTDYDYVPTPGYYGPDELTLLVEMADSKVRLKYQIRIMDLVHDDDYANLCPRLWWRTSLSFDRASGIALATARSPFDLARYAR